MRRYTLASLDARNDVDLRTYEAIIAEAVHIVMPKATVHVEKDCYYVDPTPKKGDAVKIGRQICNLHLASTVYIFQSYFRVLRLRRKHMTEKNNSTLVGITEITTRYLPVSKRKARKFVSLYMEPKRIGNRIFVDRKELENLLSNPNRERFPLNI